MQNDRRQQILEVAKELFLHYGFKKVTLVDIAKELGVSRPTVYQAFPNKEEIFTAIIDDWSDEAISQILSNRRPDAPVREQIEAAISIWTIEPHKIIQSSPNAEEFFDCSFGFAKEAIDVGYRRFSDVLETILKEGGVQTKLDHSALARLISVCLRGFKAQAESLEELEDLISQLLTLSLSPRE